MPRLILAVCRGAYRSYAEGHTGVYAKAHTKQYAEGYTGVYAETHTKQYAEAHTLVQRSGRVLGERRMVACLVLLRQEGFTRRAGSERHRFAAFKGIPHYLHTKGALLDNNSGYVKAQRQLQLVGSHILQRGSDQSLLLAAVHCL